MSGSRFDGTHAHSTAGVPLRDNLTKRLAGIISQATRISNPFLKRYCACGAPTIGATYKYQDTIIGPGALHFLACHRHDVPHTDISWLERTWGIIGRTPSDEELGV